MNYLTVSNNDTVARTVTLNYYSAAALGGTAYPICTATSIPASSSVVFITAHAPLYLEEDRSLGVTAGTANTLTVVCSYEDIS